MEKNKMIKTKTKMITDLIKILWNQTYDETEKSVHSGKNKYRLKNNQKEWMKQISKDLDIVKNNGGNVQLLINDIEKYSHKWINN